MDHIVTDAARALGRAGRWDLAVALLDRSATGPLPPDAGALRADLLADKAFWTCAPVPSPSGTDAPATSGSWAGSWSHARAGYTRLLQDRLAGRPVDRPAALALLDDLTRLRTSAPDDVAERAVRFHLGLVHENLLGDPAAATPHWTAAARIDDDTTDDTTDDNTDDDTVASALRHLGGQRADAGDDDGARELWWRSFRLRAGAGDVPGALAQLALLAPSATLADAVSEWVAAAGLTVLQGPGLATPPAG